MYYLYSLLIRFICLFRIETLHKIAGVIGVIAWHISPERRKVAIGNAKIIGCKNPEEIAKKSFINTFKSYFEFAYIQKIDKKFVDKYITEKDVENIELLINSGKTFAIASAHIGGWEIGATAVGVKHSLKSVAVGRSIKDKALDRIVTEYRNNPNLIYMSHRNFLNKIGEYEKQNYVVLALLDHAARRSDGIMVPFFGLSTPTTAGIAAWCARKNLPMLPCFSIRKNGGYELVYFPPLYPDKTLKPKERIYDLVVRTNQAYETVIKQYPDQWYLLHRRFKNAELPDGTKANSFYR